MLFASSGIWEEGHSLEHWSVYALLSLGQTDLQPGLGPPMIPSPKLDSESKNLAFPLSGGMTLKRFRR